MRGSTTDSEWTDYKVVLALKEGGSVAGAARVLGVDAATVSRRLAAAESALGAVLVVRGGRQFLFTAEGTTALEAARGMESLAASAANAIRAAKAEIEGLVRVSCVPGLASLLVAFQALVEKKHPRLRVDVSPDFHRADLAKGEADIALRMSEPKEPDLIGIQCFEAGLSAFASRSYVAARGLPATREDLRAHQIIRYTKRFADVPQFTWIDEYADANAHTMRADSLDMMLGLVASGGGIGVIDFHGDLHADLVRVFPEPSAFRPGFIVYHESVRNTARIRAVVEMLRTFLEQNAPLLSGRGPAPANPDAAPQTGGPSPTIRLEK